MKFELVCNRGLKEIELGLTRDGVRKQLPLDFESLKAQSWHAVDTDFYDHIGLRLSYTKEYILQTIMLLPHANIEFHGSVLERRKVKVLSQRLNHFGYTSKEYKGVLYYDSIGVAIHTQANSVISCELYSGAYVVYRDREEEAALKGNGA